MEGAGAASLLLLLSPGLPPCRRSLIQPPRPALEPAPLPCRCWLRRARRACTTSAPPLASGRRRTTSLPASRWVGGPGRLPAGRHLVLPALVGRAAVAAGTTRVGAANAASCKPCCHAKLPELHGCQASEPDGWLLFIVRRHLLGPPAAQPPLPCSASRRTAGAHPPHHGRPREVWGRPVWWVPGWGQASFSSRAACGGPGTVHRGAKGAEPEFQPELQAAAPLLPAVLNYQNGQKYEA